MSIISSPRPASATEPKPSPTPTSTGSPEPPPQRPGTVLPGASGRQEQDATPSAWSRQQSGTRKRSPYATSRPSPGLQSPEPANLCSPRSSRADNEERAD